MSNNEDTTKRLGATGNGDGRTIDDLFEMMQSFRAEFVEFRDKVEARLLSTTPLSETLEALRVEVRGLSERQDAFAERQDAFSEVLTREIEGLKRIDRRIEAKLDVFSSELADARIEFRNYDGRLETLEAR
jgi:archaellum component FlaC